jgi:TatD DNase family protein
MLVDSHCHLDKLADPDAALIEAGRAGVRQIVAVSEGADTMPAVLALKRRHPEQVLAGLGMHPAWVTRAGEQEVAEGLRWLEANLAEADVLGEVGLDYKWAVTDEQQARQQDILVRQFDLAERFRKPVNLHSRRAQRQTMQRAIDFRRSTGLNAQLHWFTVSKKLVRICNDEGIYVSVGPTAIDDVRTQQVALAIDRALLLLETDAPVPIGGVVGHPARVAEVAQKMAQVMDLSKGEICALTAANLQRYLGGPP